MTGPEDILKRVWGYPAFRGEQLPIIEAILSGRDGLAVMKTSGGKSLCYQVPALARPGCALVVSPLISLMQDQVDALTARGVPSTFINSSLDQDEAGRRLQDAISGKFKLLYVSPERLQTEGFFAAATQMSLSLVAVDEAHCVSTWGHDFRPAYTRIERFLNRLEGSTGQRPQRFAFTATATPDIQDDILLQLGMADPAVFVGSFDRENISMEVIRQNDRLAECISLLNKHHGEQTIIYCATVKAVEEVHAALIAAGMGAEKYHGRLPPQEKLRSQERFLNNDVATLVATSAFGMGVDKPDIRNIIHYQMPGSLENYYQEAGRAGRDGKASKSYLLYSESDRRLHEFFIHSGTPGENEVLHLLAGLRENYGGSTQLLTAEELVQASGNTLRPASAIGALHILEGQGSVTIRHVDLEVADRFSVEVPEGGPAPDLQHLADRRKSSLAALAAMERFCTTNDCRRNQLLSHFGETNQSGGCGKCDACLARRAELSGQDAPIPEQAIVDLCKAIARMGSKISDAWLPDLLVGNKTKLVAAARLDQLDVFGSLSDWTPGEVRQLMRAAQAAKLYVLPGQSLRLPKLTAKGAAIAEGSEVPRIPCPPSLLERHGPDSRTPPKHEADPASVKLRAGKLKAWRTREAARQKTSPPFILSDRLLNKLSAVGPISLAEIERCGVSPGRTARYGKELLECLEVTREYDSLPVQHELAF